MSNSRDASTRLTFDLQACQTEGSAKRGVGRAAHALFTSLLQEEHAFDIRVVVSSNLPYDVALNGLPESRVTRLPPFPQWSTKRVYQGGELDTLDALALSSTVAPLNSDIVHLPHVFEGFRDRAALPAPRLRSSGQILSATLHDIIPLIFQDHYFKDTSFRKWYFSRLSWLKQADLLLADSESSRQDAINFLGIEPWRIATIYCGMAKHLQPAADPFELRRDLAQCYGLQQRIVLYTGGDDHRKNIGGAISGYALLPAKLRRDCQLVIVCAMEPN